MDLTKPLLGVFAHPDDETFGMAGTLALAHRQGARVGVLSATRGEKGKLNLPEPLTEEELGRLRERELNAAARILGIDEVFVFGYPDGAVDTVPEEELVACVERIIRSFRPHTVVTFDAKGGTGHRDHVAMHQAATKAFHRARDFDDPPAELYYRGLPAEIRALLTEARRHSPRTAEHYHDNLEPENYSEGDLVRIDIASVLDVKAEAARAHASQNPERFLDRSRRPSTLPEEFWVSEYFYRAWPR
jgi:LmbE family N-acetylglucosaminyl deacetylase